MASYIAITDAEVQPEAPITSELMTKLRDNPIAIGERATGSPVVEGGWVPFDETTYGGSATGGVVYDFAVDGAVSQIIFPLFEVGFDYLIRTEAFAQNTNSLVYYLRKSGGAETNTILSTTASTATNFQWIFHSPMATSRCLFTEYRQTLVNANTIDAPATAQYVTFRSTTNMQVDRLRWTTGGSFNAGKVYLYRRGSYV